MTEQADLRAELECALVADLLGYAGGPEEIVDERFVRGRYVLGMLAPKGQVLLPEKKQAGDGKREATCAGGPNPHLEMIWRAGAEAARAESS